MDGSGHTEKEDTGADNHNAAQKAENGAQSAVFKAQRRRFKQTPNNGRKQSHHKEAGHNDQDSRNDDARQPSDAFKRNVFGDNRGIVHRQKDACNPAGNGQHFTQHAAHDSNDGGKCENGNDDPVDFRHECAAGGREMS